MILEKRRKKVQLFILSSLGIFILLTLINSKPLNAQNIGNGTQWVTGFFVTNTESVAANIEIEFFQEGNANARALIRKTIDPGDTSFYYLGNGGGFEAAVNDGLYSIVITSDRNVVAVANITSQKVGNLSRVNSTTSYTGLTENEIASQIFAPNILRDYFGFTSNFVVQNAGDVAASVTIKYFGPDGAEIAAAQETGVIIEPGSYIARDQATNNNLPSGDGPGLMSASVECTGCLLGGMVHISNIDSGIGTSNYTMYSQGFRGGFAPVILNDYFGFSTAINIQNQGTTPTEVSIQFFGERTTGSLDMVRTLKVSDPVAQGGLGGLLEPSQTWSVFTGPQGAVNSGANGSLPLPTGSVSGDLSAVITAPDSDVVILINTAQNSPVEFPTRATASLASYKAVQRGSRLMYASASNARAFNQEYFVSITCQNLGTQATDIYYTFNGLNTKTNQVVSNVQDSLSSIRPLQEGVSGLLNVNESFVFLLNEPNNIAGLDEGFNGSVTITADQDVACIINQNRLLDVLADEDHLGSYTPLH